MAAAAGTVTYQWPAVVQGTTTAPTTAQVSDTVVADVVMPDNSAATTITHNMGVSTNGAFGTPEVTCTPTTVGATPALLQVTFATSNTITLLNVPNANAGNGSTWRVTVKRPHSIGR